jgi:hypothetical protein
MDKVQKHNSFNSSHVAFRGLMPCAQNSALSLSIIIIIIIIIIIVIAQSA